MQRTTWFVLFCIGQVIFCAKKAPADHISVKDRGRFYSNESVTV